MIEVYTDGASTGNPGRSGAGVFIKAYGETYEYLFSLGEMSNHEAEFHAVLKAMEICGDHFQGEIISLRSDSKLVADTIEKDYTKNNKFLPFLQKFREAANYFPHVLLNGSPKNKIPGLTI